MYNNFDASAASTGMKSLDAKMFIKKKSKLKKEKMIHQENDTNLE